MGLSCQEFAGLCLIVYLIGRPGSIAGRFLSSNVMRRLGKISYCAYLIHCGVLICVCDIGKCRSRTAVNKADCAHRRALGQPDCSHARCRAKASGGSRLFAFLCSQPHRANGPAATRYGVVPEAGRWAAVASQPQRARFAAR